MELTFLGTAAAEAIPALWCECEICTTAKERGGKELRRRCSYLIDDDTLVDFGPDAFWQSVEFGVDLVNLKRIIFTHPHSDHLNPVDLHWRVAPYYSRVTKQLTVIATRPVFDKIINHFGGEFSLEQLMLEPLEVTPGATHVDGDLEIRPISASHAPGKDAVIYAIARNGKRILIANDTGWLSDTSWDTMKDLKFDTAVIESTTALRAADCKTGHMGFNITVAFRDRLREMGCLSDDSVVVANHFSHNGGANHAELVEAFGKHGIMVAYDGMKLNI